MFVVPQILNPNVMALEGGAFERWFGHEDGSLTNWISALIKETEDSFQFLAPPDMWGRGDKMAVYDHRIFPHLDLGLPCLQKCEKKTVV